MCIICSQSEGSAHLEEQRVFVYDQMLAVMMIKPPVTFSAQLYRRL